MILSTLLTIWVILTSWALWTISGCHGHCGQSLDVMGIADNQWMSWALWTISKWGFLFAGTRLMDKSRSSGATLPKASLFCKIMLLFIFINVHMCCCRVTNLIVRKITVNQNFLYMKLPLQGRFWFALSQFCFWNIKWVGGSCKTTTLYLWTP